MAVIEIRVCRDRRVMWDKLVFTMIGGCCRWTFYVEHQWWEENHLGLEHKPHGRSWHEDRVLT